MLEPAKEWQDIAEKLIDKYPVNLGHIRVQEVLFLKDVEKASGNKYAVTQLVKEPFTFITNYKFIITFYENKTLAMNDAQKHLLVFHELLHIDDNFEKIRKHDLEDFVTVIAKFGPQWDVDDTIPDILDNNTTI